LEVLKRFIVYSFVVSKNDRRNIRRKYLCAKNYVEGNSLLLPMGLFDLSYPVAGWTLVALVVIPFLFGVLFGIKTAQKRFIVKLVKVIDSKKLKTLVDDIMEDEDENGRLDPAPIGCGDSVPGLKTDRN
jgi:hypothetical protein